MPRLAWAIVFAAMLLSLPTARAQDAYVPNQGTNDIKIFDVLDPSDTVTLGTGSQSRPAAWKRSVEFPPAPERKASASPTTALRPRCSKSA
jgi:hypothetical protein